jgi:hypothetical protein
MTGAPAAPQFQQPQYGQPVAQPQGYPGNLPQGDFADPRAGGGGELAPRVRHMVGRTVIIEPLRVDENAKGMPDANGQATSRPAAYANVTVVDGGPIQFGDEIKSGRQIRPNTHVVNAPYRIMNMMISNTWIVNAIRDALPPLGNGLLLGVIEEGQQGNRPFLLTKCETTVNGQDRPDGAQRREAARQLWQQIKAGQFTNPPIALLQPVAGSAYGQQAPAQYAPQGYQQAPQMYGPTPQQAGYVPAQYAPQGYQQQSIAPNTASMVNAAAPVSAPAAAQQQAPAGLPAGFDVTQVPPGWDAGAWQGFAANPQQAAAIWTNVIAQNPAILNQAPAALQGQPMPAAGPGW